MFELLGKFILIKKIGGENKSRGGIYLTEESSDGVAKAEVVSFSKEIAEFNVGDIITYPKQCYLMQITIEGKVYFTIRPEEIVGIEK